MSSETTVSLLTREAQCEVGATLPSLVILGVENLTTWSLMTRYTLSVSVTSQNLYVEPDPHCDDIGRWELRELMRSGGQSLHKWD